jgi:hypothetical protein
MPYEVAKNLLQQAQTALEKKAAIKSALQLGMPLHEIEQYLDWLALARAQLDHREEGTT